MQSDNDLSSLAAFSANFNAVLRFSSRISYRYRRYASDSNLPKLLTLLVVLLYLVKGIEFGFEKNQPFIEQTDYLN